MAPLSIKHELHLLSDKKRSAVRLVVWTFLLFFVLICTLAGWHIWDGRRAELHDAQVNTTNIAQVLALHTQTTMKVADLVLADLAEQAEREGLQGENRIGLREHLEKIKATTQELYGLFIYDAAGDWIASSISGKQKGNNADREYFKYHQRNADRRTHIGAPVRSKSTGVWIIPVSRRLQTADGRFAGVVLVTLRVDFFESAYNKLDVGETGTIVLTHEDGMLYYRRPFIEKNIGLDIASGPLIGFYRKNGQAGTAMLTSKLDGIQRLYSYRHLDGFPLIVAAALSSEEIYAAWWTSTLKLILTLVLFVAVLLWLGKRLLQQLSIREGLEQRLHIVSDGLAQANAELSALALTDGLTQLANRRAFDHAIYREAARAGRDDTPVSLLMLDVDHFKKYNDKYGHPAGDDCLRRIANAIASEVTRPCDLVARYGGEEFVVLLPGTGPEGAVTVAERIQHAVSALHITHEYGEKGKVTVSIGGATLHPSGLEATQANLIAAADKALYAAKERGRNRLHFQAGPRHDAPPHLEHSQARQRAVHAA